MNYDLYVIRLEEETFLTHNMLFDCHNDKMIQCSRYILMPLCCGIILAGSSFVLP